jgi:hypothetical protein
MNRLPLSSIRQLCLSDGRGLTLAIVQLNKAARTSSNSSSSSTFDPWLVHTFDCLTRASTRIRA